MILLPFLFFTVVFRWTKSLNESSRKEKFKTLLNAKIHEETKALKESIIITWWFKIVLYLMSFTCMTISILLIIIKGKFEFFMFDSFN
jgi:hypothetical protein